MPDFSPQSPVARSGPSNECVSAYLSTDPWYAVQVKHQFERCVSFHLRAIGYETLAPTYRVRRRWSDRLKTIDMPLLPGYVFCQFNEAVAQPLHRVPGVTGILSFGGTLAQVDTAELNAIRAVLGADMVARPWPFLRAGQKVELIRGPLKGLEGIVVRDKGQYRLVLSVTVLNSSVAVEIERDWIRPLDQLCSTGRVFAQGNRLAADVVSNTAKF